MNAGSPPPETQPPKSSSKPLDAAYDVALLDLDGVVYLGGTAIPGAAEALRKADSSGMRLAYVTNNSSRTPSAIAAQVAGFGVPVDFGPTRLVRSGALAGASATALLPGAPSALLAAACSSISTTRTGYSAKHSFQR